jgi:hypothetical protein
VSIVGGVVLRMVKSPGMSPELNCFDMQVKQSFEIKKACYNNSNKELISVMRRAFDEKEINAVDFVFTGENGSNSWRCGGDCGLCRVLNSGETKTYYFDFSDLTLPKEMELRVGSCGLGKMRVVEC